MTRFLKKTFIVFNMPSQYCKPGITEECNFSIASKSQSQTIEADRGYLTMHESGKETMTNLGDTFVATVKLQIQQNLYSFSGDA